MMDSPCHVSVASSNDTILVLAQQQEDSSVTSPIPPRCGFSARDSPVCIHKQLLLDERSFHCQTQQKSGSKRSCAASSSFSVTFREDRNTYIESNDHVDVDLWYSKQERDSFLRDMRRCVRSCYRNTSPQHFKTFLAHLINNKRQRDFLNHIVLHFHEYRGLERQIHSGLSNHRRRYVQAILLAQFKLSTATTTTTTATQRQRALAAHSTKLTSPSRTLAKLLAYNDYLQVVSTNNNKVLSG